MACCSSLWRFHLGFGQALGFFMIMWLAGVTLPHTADGMLIVSTTDVVSIVAAIYALFGTCIIGIKPYCQRCYRRRTSTLLRMTRKPGFGTHLKPVFWWYDCVSYCNGDGVLF